MAKSCRCIRLRAASATSKASSASSILRRSWPGWCRSQTRTEASAALETEIPGVAAFTRPPASFNPLTATDAELDRYGFPSRPSRDLGADVLARWERRVMSQSRIVPQLKQTNTFHAPVRSIKQIKASGGTIEANSENWSGYAIVDSSNPFAKPGSQVEVRYIVPKPVS